MVHGVGKDWTKYIEDDLLALILNFDDEFIGCDRRDTHRRQVVECFLKESWWLGYCSSCGDTLETEEVDPNSQSLNITSNARYSSILR